MRKSTLIFFVLALAVSFGQIGFAQDPPQVPESARAAEAPAHFYHLDFVIQELGADGKPANSRSYSATVSTDPRDHGTSIRTGSKLPIATGSSSSSNGKELFDTQWQYVDVGVNIDVHSAREAGRQLSLELIADVSSMAAPSDPNLHHPVIRQNKWQASVLIPIGKATVVFTSDSLDSKGSMQVVVTATPLQ